MKLWYIPESKLTVKEMSAERNIKGGEVLVAVYCPMPISNQTGIRIMAPPRPRLPPTNPAQKPHSIQFLIFYEDILSEAFSKTNPKSSFL